MTKRIVLIHALHASMAPIVAAFHRNWPDARVLNILDETIYADVGPDGVLPAGMEDRIAGLLRQAERGGADGIVFTGSTFGPAVDAVRGQVGVPVLKADEAMCAEAVATGGRITVACTARRALPVIRANIEAAAAEAGARPAITELCVEGAKDAITAGDHETHDRLIAETLAAARDYDVLLLGQVSMVPARARLSPTVAARVLTSPDASVARMRALVGG